MAGTQVAVIVAYRTHEARKDTDLWHMLTGLEMEQRVTRVAVGGLEYSNIAALATATATRPLTPDLIERLSGSTGGNPLFVIETIRAIERNPTSAELGDVIDDRLHGRATVDRVKDVLIAEIDAAPAPVQGVVSAMSVWGSSATSATISRLLMVDIGETVDAIRAGVAAEFITESDGRYKLRFEQLNSAADARLQPDERRSLHRIAADLLAEDPLTSAAELANHYRLAEAWPQAARYEAAAASRAASLHAYEIAGWYYGLALDSADATGESLGVGCLFGYDAVADLLGDRDQQGLILDRLEQHPDLTLVSRLRVMQRRAMYHANTDEFMDAISVSCRAVGLAASSGVAATPYVVTLARVLVMAGHPDLARAHLEGLVDDGDTESGLAQAHLALGQALTDVQDLDQAERHLRIACELFEQHEDTRGQVDALAAIAVLHSQVGNVVEARRSYSDAIRLAQEIGHRFGEGMSLANLGVLHYISGDPAAALGSLDEAIDVFTRIGHRRGEASARANTAAILHTIIGDDARAEHEATLARRYFVEIGDRRHEAQCLDVLAGIRRRKRAYAVSRRLLEDALRIVRATSDHWLEAQMLRSLAWTEYDAGRPAQALTAVRAGISVATEYGLELELASLFALEARSLLLDGKTEEAWDAAIESQNANQRSSELEHIGAWWRFSVFQALDLPEEAEAELLACSKLLTELLDTFDDDRRQLSLSKVMEHRLISIEYASRFPRTETALLAPQSNPTAEPSIVVEWTVHHPDDLGVKDKKERRKCQLLRILDEAHLAGAHPRVEDLAKALGASGSTLKRDLAALRAEGLIV